MKLRVPHAYEPEQRYSRSAAYVLWPVLIAGIGAAVLTQRNHEPGFDCQNPLPENGMMTIHAGAKVRTHPHVPSEDYPNNANFAGKRLKADATFSTADVEVCVSDNSSLWYGFQDGELSAVTGQEYHGNDQGAVWISEIKVDAP